MENEMRILAVCKLTAVLALLLAGCAQAPTTPIAAVEPANLSAPLPDDQSAATSGSSEELRVAMTPTTSRELCGTGQFDRVGRYQVAYNLNHLDYTPWNNAASGCVGWNLHENQCTVFDNYLGEPKVVPCTTTPTSVEISHMSYPGKTEQTRDLVADLDLELISAGTCAHGNFKWRGSFNLKGQLKPVGAC